MKNIILSKRVLATGVLILIATIILCSCDMNLNKDELPPDLQNCNSEKEILTWIRQNITYKKDIKQYGGIDYWAAPERTLESREGDCEDFSILFGYLCDILLNKNIKIVTATNIYGKPGHAFNKIDNRYIEPQGGNVEKYLTSNNYFLTEYDFNFLYPLIKNNRG